MASAAPTRWRGGRSVFLPAFLLLALLSITWALATPIFASPDENAHATKAIAQVRGEVFGHTTAGSRFPVVDLPDDYRYPASMMCFAYDAQTPASCGAALGGKVGTDYFATWVSTYNPVYYYVVGWPSLIFGGSTGIYAMRFIGALLCSALLAGAFWAAMAGGRSRWMPAALAFLASPMVVFLSASISPQGMEVAAGALLTVSLLRLVEQHGDPTSVSASRRALWAVVTVSAVLLALARAVGPLWVVIIVAGVMTAVGWRTSALLFRRRGSYPWIAVILVFGLFSLIWTALTGTVSGQAEKADAPLVGGSFLDGAWAMLRQTPNYLQSAAGVFGWLDTVLPGLVYALFFGAVLLLVALALAASTRRGRWTVIAALLLALLVPVVVQGASVSRTGIIWQGRYGLFLYLSVILVASWVLSNQAEDVRRVSSAVTVIINSVLGVYGIAAFAYVMHRYVVGEGGTVTKMLHDPAWQPPLGWIALTAVDLVLCAAFAVWNSRLAVSAARREDVVADA